MKKKLLGMLFVLELLLVLPSVVSLAATANGNLCGATGNENGVTWALDDEGTLTISGTGAMADYDAASSVPWNGSVATIKTVVIEDGVSKIGANAFYGCKNLNSVTIAKSVNFIGFGAFLNCTRLTDVYYAGTQENWNSITKMDSMYNFILHYHCGATDNDNVYWGLFNGTLIISGSGEMKDYTDGNSVPWNQFSTEIEDVVIKEGVKNIGTYAFNNCTNLTVATIPKSVTKIGDYGFLPSSESRYVNYVGTFDEWNAIESGGNGWISIILSSNYVTTGSCGTEGNNGDNVTWELVNGNTLIIRGKGDMKDYAEVIDRPWGPSDVIKTVVIEDGVTKIGNNAFYGCTKLTSMKILMKEIISIGEYAFFNCQNLTDVYYAGTPEDENNRKIYDKIYGFWHYKCGAEDDDNVYWALFDGTLTISGNGTMANYQNASEVPWNVSIKDINNVKIGYGVINVGANAFYGCQELTSITIPESVTSIGSSAFQNCTKLTSVTIPNSVTNVGANAFNSCANLTSVTISNRLDTISERTFEKCTGLNSVTIPKSVTTIGSGTFNGCTNLASVIILSRNITSIGNNAFNGCSKLTAIYMPKDCSIDTSAIPESINQIKYEVEHTTEGVNGETIVAITSVTRSVDLNCDSMGNGYYIIKNEAGDSVTLSDVCKPNDDTITHTGYSMRMRKKINAENHVYGCVVDGERRCIDCGAKQTCTGNPSEVKSGNLTYNCYTCGDGIKVVELNLAAM